jgi:hypothetical protein
MDKNFGVGPGQYIGIDTNFDKFGRCAITIKQRHGDGMIQNKQGPGPGQYNPDIDAVKSNQGGAKFPNSKRLDLSGEK